jgi:hypothetical protein
MFTAFQRIGLPVGGKNVIRGSGEGREPPKLLDSHAQRPLPIRLHQRSDVAVTVIDKSLLIGEIE